MRSDKQSLVEILSVASAFERCFGQIPKHTDSDLILSSVSDLFLMAHGVIPEKCDPRAIAWEFAVVEGFPVHRGIESRSKLVY